MPGKGAGRSISSRHFSTFRIEWIGNPAEKDDFPDAEFLVLSQDPRPQKTGRIQALPWDQGVLAL